jgi:signal transduction histidine kinase
MIQQRGIVSLLLVPILIENEVVGSLGLDAIEPRHFSSEDVDLAQSVANQVSGALARARLGEERKGLEEQYHQAQKMEAIGRLTGGIAHDFNNQLTAIMGYAELIQYRMPADDPLRGMVDSIMRSGQHAADLIGQLLAFSRKQIIEPKVLDVNRIVTEMGKMLQPIIGENTQSTIKLSSDLWPIKADPIQLEQVVANLVVNARDAMPDGGQLMIETANVTLDESYLSSHFELQPGAYVLLAISDTGCGMSEHVKTRIFEPFFTTKGRGEGTGLGLATVYGIVKQNNGDIQVYSEEGVGTTFKIYFPRTGESAPEPDAKTKSPLPSGSQS